MLTFTLLIIGGLNWLLVGAFNLDLVALIFGEMTVISKVIYVLVGISAIVEVFARKSSNKAY